MLEFVLVTCNLAKDWDRPATIDRCTKAGIATVELRTTHVHGVEPALSKKACMAVKEMFGKSRVHGPSLGTTCDYRSVEAEEVARNIEITKEFVELKRLMHYHRALRRIS